MKKIAIYMLSCVLWCAGAAVADDPPAGPDAATVLAQILAQKGTISAQELSRVESAAAQDRVSVLAGILRQKGLLDPADLAKLGVPAAAPGPLPGPSSQPAPAPTSAAASSPNQPSVPQQAQPVSPALAETGKRVPVSLYGTLLLNAGFNGAGMNLNDAGSIVSKPGSSDTASDQTYFESPRQTRVGIRLDPTPAAGGLLTGAFEIDAYSSAAPFPDGINMGLFRLRLAYGRIDWHNFALEIGQDWSIFAPLDPSSLAMYAVAEFNGSGNPWARIPQVRIEAKDKLNSTNRLLYQFAVSDPDDGDYAETFNGTRPPGAGELGHMPALESRLAWSITDGDRDYTLGFSGRYGRGKNLDTVGSLTESEGVNSWGAAVDYTLPFSHLFNLSGEAYIGRALGIYDVSVGEDIGLVGTPGGQGVLSRGGWSQAEFKLGRHWELNGGYGIDQPSARDLPVGSRFRNENVFGNFIYSLDKNFQWSLEYRRLLTYFRDEGIDTGRANQFTLSAAYLF